MSASARVVALTAGEPAGIGPDLCAMYAHERFDGRLVIVGDAEVIHARARLRGLEFDLPAYRRGSTDPVSVLHVPVAVPVEPGKLDARNAIRQRKADEAYQDWLRQSRDRAFVENRYDER